MIRAMVAASQPASFGTYRRVWVEITSELHEHGGKGWELGTCLWSPTKTRNGQDRYALMREPKPEDLVLHFAERRSRRRDLVGWSLVSQPPRVVLNEPPLPGSWQGRREYYRVDLKGFIRVGSPVSIEELIATRGKDLRAEIDDEHPQNHPFTRYGDGVRLAAGLYLRQCSRRLFETLFGSSTRPALAEDQLTTPESVPLEERNTESFAVRTAEGVRAAARREARLVARYAAHLRKERVCRRRYGQLFCDLFVESRRHLIEAKADASRESVRMAIGQLYDYARFERANVQLAVLLPERPLDDLLELLEGVGIGCVWATRSGFDDSRGGEFS